MTDITFLPATTMARQIREKKLSPVELAEAHLAKIERLNPNLNAFVHIDTERVRREARAAEAAVISGKALGPLHGVPISIKSSLEVAGLRCESGTRLRVGFVGSQDAPLVARLRDAGAIVLGVTNTPELLMAWETGLTSVVHVVSHAGNSVIWAIRQPRSTVADVVSGSLLPASLRFLRRIFSRPASPRSPCASRSASLS